MSPIYLSLDVGDARIGVAISRSGVIAEPLATIERRGRKQTLDALSRIISENGVTQVVAGLPLLESGVAGEQAEKTRAFCRSLARRIPKLAIEYHDERYSSTEARAIAAGRIADGQNKDLVDRIAAAVILQSYLDAKHDEKKKDELEEHDGG